MGGSRQKELLPQSERSRAIRRFVLGRMQIISATVCLYFLVTTGASIVTIVTALIAMLLVVLSLTFRLNRRTVTRM